MDTLKKELWELLRIFDHICREEHIDYWVDYGTLLGAVRHQGFIPWDDDIDVSMRDVYKRQLYGHTGPAKTHIAGLSGQNCLHCVSGRLQFPLPLLPQQRSAGGKRPRCLDIGRLACLPK